MMKTLHFDYHMEIVYSEPVEKCHYTLKCIPGESRRQRVETLEAELLPENRWCRGTDSFGNEMLFGSVEERHDCFCCHVRGEVTTGLTASREQGPEGMLGMYRYPHGLAVPGEGLLSYRAQLSRENGAVSEALSQGRGSNGPACVKEGYGRAVGLMHRLYQDFRYEKCVTNLTTTAEEAWQLRRGVCQDYAHILIALCRLEGIPARYVAGLMAGEGESHAWVEILSDGQWYGLDPTNDLVVNEDYICLGVGRDAADCTLNRGIVLGGGLQRQKVTVAVREV